jgi:hypothetical protein
MNEYLDKNGFIVLKKVFSLEQINKMKKISLKYFSEDGGFQNAGGFAKPDWIKEEKLKDLLSEYCLNEIESLVSRYVGKDVHFIGHNDLHLNRSVGWHKDQLNGEARKYQINSPWDTVEGKTMQIYKVNLYLQDHSSNEDGLTVRLGSHKFPEMERGIVKQIKPNLGDIVLFDQRISHKAKWSGGYNRVLICMGFGVKNIFFDQFEKGTEFRQNKQNGVLR